MRVNMLVLWFAGCLIAMTTGQLIQNGGFETMDHWSCYSGFTCTIVSDHHSGQHSIKVSNRTHSYNGPGQTPTLTPGKTYHMEAWAKVLTDHAGQSVQMEIDFTHNDNTHDYHSVARHSNARVSDGWFHIQGEIQVPNTNTLKSIRLYFQSGPAESVDYQVDDVTITEVAAATAVTDADLNQSIDHLRKSNIQIHANLAAGMNAADVQIHVLQTKKSFPFGTAVNANPYNSHSDPKYDKYRDFIHRHFNWAVPENSLKWHTIESTRGHRNYQPALDMIHGLKSHGLKVRGHNLVWSVPHAVQAWLQALSGQELRDEVSQYIQEVMNVTRGLLEHWDVDNENLHGTWFQDRLHDPSYNLELFRIAHRADPSIRLFLNDYSVVASGGSTNDYLAQAQQFKAAGPTVALSGMGVQCHFGNEQEPNPGVMKQRLDRLAQAGVPIWATELNVMSADENKRADFAEKALRTLYAHPSVEGILFWGFWDQRNSKGEKAALVIGDNLDLTAAGRRVLDLFENQWMTDETHALPGNHQLSVRGFHGDYEVHVMYQGTELANLKQTFTLGKSAHTVNLDIHT